jgi:hypothetical protein
MARVRRRGSSDLYQVDFVAALFGGFMLIWLSSIGEIELPPNSGESPVFFQIYSRVYFYSGSNAGSPNNWVTVLPMSVINQTCAHDHVVNKFRSNENQIRPCYASANPPLPFPDSGTTWFARVEKSERYSRNLKMTDPFDGKILSSWGIDMQIVLDGPKGKRVAPLLGLALLKVPISDQNNMALGADYIHVALGIIPDGDRISSVKISHFGTFANGLFSVAEPTLSSTGILEKAALVNYHSDSINRTVPPTPTYALDVNEWQLKVIVDPAGSAECHVASSRDANITAELPMDRRC